jgi:hypothetical protein
MHIRLRELVTKNKSRINEIDMGVFTYCHQLCLQWHGVLKNTIVI